MGHWKLLFVDDSDLDVMLAVRAIRAAGQSLAHARIDTAAGFAERLAAEHWDAVICDHQMPAFDALSALRQLLATGHDIPLLIVSGVMPNELAIAAMREGARDFIGKDHLSRLVPAIERELRAAQNRAHLRQANSSIERLLSVDQLTGLPNGDALHLRLRELVGGGNAVALMLLDIVRFRRLKQLHGIVQANRVLRLIAARLTARFSSEAMVARVGPGRFALLLPGVGSAGALDGFLARVAALADEAVDIDGVELPVSTCFGGSVFPLLAHDAGELMRQAEAALDYAKRDRAVAGRIYGPGMGAAIAHELGLESALYRAAVNDDFELYYQPRFDLGSRRPVGLEALLRWRNAAGVVLPATEFIRSLEDSGLILSVGEWVLDEVLRQQEVWRAAAVPVPRVSINLSALQLRQPDFAAAVIDRIRRAGGDPADFEFEFSESAAMGCEEALIGQLAALRQAGASLAIDDFGAGYSSLSWLPEFPLDRITIDRRIVVAGDSGTRTVRAIVSLANEFGVAVLGEGVETEAQAAALAAAGCIWGQGFLWAAALPPALAGEFISRLSD